MTDELIGKEYSGRTESGRVYKGKIKTAKHMENVAAIEITLENNIYPILISYTQAIEILEGEK